MRIIDTGRHRPKARIWDLWELQSNRKRIVQKPIEMQSRRDKTVIYGRHAVNRILGPGYHRDTYDFDVYSGMPRKHAVQLERSIDRGTNSNLAYVERTSYPVGGRKKCLYRVRTRIHDGVEADYNVMPRNIGFVTRGGVRYESLGRAEKKYKGMIGRNEVHRFPNAFFDLSDVQTHNFIKKYRRRTRSL